MIGFRAPRAVLVRPLSATYADCLRADPLPIDLELARAQHAAYVAAIRASGLEVVEIPAAEALPDAVFVEDPIVVLGVRALVTRPGAPSREAEVASVAEAVGNWCQELRLAPFSARLDGGDVLRVGARIFVGRSRRTNAEGIASLAALAREEGIETVEIPVRAGLHLKSAATLASPDLCLVDPGAVDPSAFWGLEVLKVDEPAGANVLHLGPLTLVSAAAPRTAEALARRGIPVQVLDVGEIHKGDGALTCCSIRIPHPGSWCT